MGRRRERNEESLSSTTADHDENCSSRRLEKEQMISTSSLLPAAKKQKTAVQGSVSDVAVIDTTQVVQTERPKSKKELRAERKKARLVATDPASAAALLEAEKRRQKKEQEREEFRRLIREERKELKARQQKKLNREKNAPGGGNNNADSSSNEKKSRSVEETKKGSNQNGRKKKESSPKIVEEEDVARKIMHEIKYGKSDTSGWTTLQLGVKYKDVVVGKGPLVQNKSLVTVKYQLTGGKFGVVIDSSKKFNFRVGKGEVIQGWDIGVAGMREGGRRQLIVPPKAGYGSKDIGAGSGGLLNFDVTVLAVRV